MINYQDDHYIPEDDNIKQTPPFSSNSKQNNGFKIVIENTDFEDQ